MNAAFYCVTSSAYFLGAVGMINSLRLVGHRESVYVLDCGLSEAQRRLLAGEATVIEAPAGREPFTLKAEAPLRHLADPAILIDADVIVTRSLAPLLERAAGGRVVAFVNPTDRFVAEWEQVLELSPLRRQRYLCSGFVALGEPLARTVLTLLEDRQGRVRFERGYFGANDHGYELMFADQDVLNAILASRVPADRIDAIDWRLAPMPPFAGLRVTDEHNLGCAYDDGSQPYLVHQALPFKPWLEPLYDGVYSRLLRRLLAAPDLAIRVPDEMIPRSLRRGPLGFVERSRVKARDQIRWRLGAVRRPRAEGKALSRDRGA